MTGRVENEMRIEKSNNQKVAEMPAFVANWYMNMKASRKTAATCRDYLNKIHHYLESINPDVKAVDLSDITEQSVTKYYLSIQTKETEDGIAFTSDSYQSTVWCCLDNFLGYLSKTGLLSTNYIRNIDKPKNRDLERINEHRVLLTSKEFKEILRAIDREKNVVLRKRNKALILLFMNTGMRCTAMATIMMDDIDYDERILRIIDKGNKRHEYFLNDEVISALTEWLAVRRDLLSDHDDKGYLFVSERDNHMHNDTISNAVKKYTTSAIGRGLSPHKLRAGYCSILYEQTGDIEFVRRAVGHSNVATTQRYVVTKGSEKKRAAEIMGSLL